MFLPKGIMVEGKAPLSYLSRTEKGFLPIEGNIPPIWLPKPRGGWFLQGNNEDGKGMISSVVINMGIFPHPNINVEKGVDELPAYMLRLGNV
jgi:hypothetical protein